MIAPEMRKKLSAVTDAPEGILADSAGMGGHLARARARVRPLIDDHADTDRAPSPWFRRSNLAVRPSSGPPGPRPPPFRPPRTGECARANTMFVRSLTKHTTSGAASLTLARPGHYRDVDMLRFPAFAAIALAMFACLAMRQVAGRANTPSGFEPPRPFRIEIIDASNGWPVPLVELRTTGNLRFVSDNAGVIAMDAPELMQRETWFSVSGHGYEVPADGFGFRGVRVTAEPGKAVQIKVKRTSIARRLGRITGAGIFAESQKLGERLEWRESGVVGCDSVQNTVHRGRLFWLWGDTALFHYPLGVFDATSATTALWPIDEFEPPIALKFDYFVDDKGVPRGVARMPGEGPTWVTDYVSLPDASGRDRLMAVYSKIRKPMNVYEWGLCAWDDDTQRFEHVKTMWREQDAAQRDQGGVAESSACPEGHASFWTDEQGVNWVLFGNPLPKFRCRATYEAFLDIESWERLAPQETLRIAGEGDANRTVKPHSGSIAWHPWRKRWVAVFIQWWGEPSAFGEVWYAEADSPLGPWGPAVKILSHDNYTFYNPRIHAEWFEESSPALVFEGTHSKEFANRPEPTPRYDYNQVLYRVDMDDAALEGARAGSGRPRRE
jgi:hypothetical protein